jgi:hypothetical protein
MYLQSLKSVKHNAAKSVNRSILKKSRHIGVGVLRVHSSLEMAIWMSKNWTELSTLTFISSLLYMLSPMRWKARGLAQHNSPPGWPEESDPAGVILYVMDNRTACLFRTVLVALTRAVQLRAAVIK